MKPDDPNRIPSNPPTPQSFATQRPAQRILMTPLMSAVGGLLAFFSVVFFVVLLPTTTYKPPASYNWLPLTNQQMSGRALYLSNGCLYCHSGFTRPQDVMNGLYYLYPRISDPGDFYGIDQTPNNLGSERTGPDLSQEGGNHPEDWHIAHYMNPRNVNPFSVMPSFRFWTKQQMADAIAFNQASGGKEAILRTSTVEVGKNLMLLNMGMIDAEKAFPDLVQRLNQAGTYQAGGKPSDSSPSGLPWMAVWMMNSFQRSYWLTSDPLPVTQENLGRGKIIFLQRCTGCHGVQGNGKGPAAQFLKPPPFDFTDTSMTGVSGPFAGDGFFYHRMLTAGPGTAMENFGTRLTVEDMWRVVLFLRTIQNGSSKDQATVPTVDMYQAWTPPPPLLKYIDSHPIIDAPPPGKAINDPFLLAAEWIAPGMALGDEILVGGKMPVDLQVVSGLVKARYVELVHTAIQDAQARGEELPPTSHLLDTSSVTWHAP